MLPSTSRSGADGTLSVWPAGVSDPMMAALPSGRLLVARTKHKGSPLVSPARFHCMPHDGCGAQRPPAPRSPQAQRMPPGKPCKGFMACSMMAALPSGRLLVARTKHKERPLVSALQEVCVLCTP